MRKLDSGLIEESKVMLSTDMYQLTMSRGYRELEKQDEIATFDLFVRKLPKQRSYMVVAGLEQALWYLTEGFKFDEKSIEFLKTKKQFKDAKKEFWDYLRNLEFEGDVWAMSEGELAFGNEPIARVTAPIIQAQLAETYLLSQYNHQTKIASKAARCFEAAEGRPIIEFGMRRTDPGAALRGARAAYIGGAIGSSNVLADYIFDIPSYGTHAHSWVESFVDELTSFEAYFKVFGDETVALIDTYDTVTGARRAASLPGKIKGVRLDSGDLCELSKEVREVLDENGQKEGIIFASSDLNEYKIARMLADGAKIDAFGVGTELILSKDAPALGGVYKLSMLNDDAKLKLSKNKATLPGIKQVHRTIENGYFAYDTIALADEKVDGKSLLHQYIRKGKLLSELPTIHKSREYALQNISQLSPELRTLEITNSYEVRTTSALDELSQRLAEVYGK